ncbi:MAG: hypothetical protein AMJ81_11545 [Phycisphaerae bacterium SM23_33]|nr:MAG: hypothetical protein AMJ81_11545 [Phycisphaerae bacterium SM23_33]
MLVGMVLCVGGRAAGGALDRQGKQWVPVEWSLRNPDWKGNPFDLAATAAFSHAESRERITTGMFHDGGDTWKFRFTGTRPGKWTFETASAAKALDGRSGTVTVAPDPGGRGFVTGFGSKWGWSGTGEVFVPQLVMYKSPDLYHGKGDVVDRDIKTFLVEHGFNGFHTMVFCRWFDIHQEGATGLGSKDPNPDPRTFEALELLIRKTHAAGGMVHIWAWGDESRAQTPLRLGGKNGPADRRLQRYIAARLGPLPGWTMGYGYDLWEWVKPDEMRTWHAHMRRQLGWPHLLGGRAHKNRLSQICEGLDYSGYEQHRPDYKKYCETLDKRPSQPSFSEDRFRIRQAGGYAFKDYDMAMTRRGLWHSTLAGGVANIWGRLDRQDSRLGSKPYARPEWIKTWSLFFRNRFLKDMTRDNRLTDGACLARPTKAHYVFYKEDADSIRMDLSKMAGPQPAVAVDALKPYKEIDLGRLQPQKHTWKAPHKSDWAIAVGEFSFPQ